MNTISRLQRLLVVPLLTGPALTQVPPAGGYGLSPYVHTISEPDFENTERIVFGNIFGDLYPGAVTLTGGTVYGIFDPVAHQSVFTIVPSGVFSMDLVPEVVRSDPANVAVAMADGVWLCQLDVSEGAPDPIVETQIDSTLTSLNLIRTGRIDHLGFLDLVCVDGDDVYLLVNDGTSWGIAASFTASGMVVDAAVIDWDPNVAEPGHVALLLDQSVEIWGPSGTSPLTYSLDQTFLAAAAGGYLSTIPASSADPVERLAYAVALPNASYALATLSYTGFINCGVLDAVPNSVVGALLTSSPGVSRSDLLTTTLEDSDARLYNHRASVTPPYVAGSPNLNWTAGLGTPSGAGTPAFKDITGDGIPDGLIENGDLYFFAGKWPSIDHPNILDPVAGGDAWSDVIIQDDVASFPNDATLEITIDLPDSSPSFTNVQLIMWKTGPDPQNEFELERQMVKNYHYPIAPINGEQTFLLILDGKDGVCGDPFTEGYFLSVRLIKVQNGEIDDATEFIHGGFALDEDTVLLFEENETTIVPISLCAAGTPRPGFVPLPTLPPLEDDLPPIIIPSEPPPGS